VLALAKPFNYTEEYILCQLPLARAHQQLTALGLKAGARMVWPSTYQTADQALSTARALLPQILRSIFDHGTDDVHSEV
jgi:hypothetical protein